MTAILLDTHARVWSLTGDERLLAATAMHRGLPLVSADTVFDGMVTRVW
ncbi:hypothetical protein [Azospirillum halopraeferens]|nr:hypothetical protein [Azospirillum halopraeferens]